MADKPASEKVVGSVSEGGKPVAVPLKKDDVQKKKRKPRREPDEQENVLAGLDYQTFENTKGVPFVADYLGVVDYYKQDLEGDIQPKVDFITRYLLGKGDLVEMGKDILEGIISRLNITDDVKSLARLERIYRYIKATKRISQLDLKRRALGYMIEEEQKKAKEIPE